MWSNKDIKRCCVISKVQKKEQRIQNCIVGRIPEGCQFEKYRGKEGFEDLFNDTYKNDGNHYCILHLPLENPWKKTYADKVANILALLLREKHSSYSYSQIESCVIDNFNGDNLIFNGCIFSSLTIQNVSLLNQLSMDYCKFNGYTKIENNSVDRFYLKKSIIDSSINFNLNTFSYSEISENCISLDLIEKNLIYPDSNKRGIIFENGFYGGFLFKQNEMCAALDIQQEVKFKSAHFIKNKFYVIPIFHQLPFQNLNSESFILPEKDDFKVNKKAAKEFLQRYYRRFQSIYEIAKKSGNRNAIKDYFCLEKRFYFQSQKFYPLLFLGNTFDLIDEYGTNIKRQFIIFSMALLSIFLFSIKDWILWVAQNFPNHIDDMKNLSFGWIFKNAPSLKKIVRVYLKFKVILGSMLSYISFFWIKFYLKS